MTPPLRKRLRLADRSAAARSDRGVMARALMYAYAAGAVLALASLAATAGENMVVAGASALVCCAAAAVLVAGYDELPRWSLLALVALGTVLIGLAVYTGGPSYAPLLALPAGYAVYFFRKVAAAAQLALVLGGYAAAALLGPEQPLHEVAVTAFGLAAAAGLVGLQRANVNRVIWRLSDAAITDELTGLLNRRGFHELFETELERSRRSGRPLSLIVGDLDLFKALNDHFGHAAGDRALERLSLILGTAKRRIDTAARIGGEEFAVVLPDSDHHAAYILAERMRREVRETFMYEPYELTISLGVATFPMHGTDTEALVSQADEALYAAKALGRDRSVVWGEDLDEEVLTATGAPSVRSERHTATMRALADVVDARDRGSNAHSQAVGRYAAAIARELGLPPESIERVAFGGVVHDVGKIGVPDAVLRKPGWLDAEDWHELRRHPEIGARILSGAKLDEVGNWVLAHHERPDGTGYPHGIAGGEIPLEARILAVADAYEAMTADRVYRAALTPEQARAELVRCAGTQFDRRVVEAFLRALANPAELRGLRLVR
jgi:two-component system cell cycle response regulator